MPTMVVRCHHHHESWCEANKSCSVMLREDVVATGTRCPRHDDEVTGAAKVS
jgi:hypothetical protein